MTTMNRSMLAALLAGTTLGAAPTAFAQTDETAPVQASTEISPEAAEIEFLKAQLDAMQEQLGELKKQVATSTPSFKGGPLFSSPEGFTFKPKGFMQFDAGYVGQPEKGLRGTVGGLNTQNLGWNTRARRIVFGAEGTLPGGFGYKAEFNFAQGGVDYEDILLSYQPKGSPLQVQIGNFYPLSSLETMTSSRLGSFLERATLTEAFAYNRRLGLSVGLADPNDRYTLTAGVFSQTINSAASDSGNANNRTGWQASIRGTFSPTLGDTRLHLGANFQHRVAQRDSQNVRYRTRPFTQVTDERFVDTNLIAADGDDVVGIELAAIHGPFHFASEAQKLWVRGYAPGKVFGNSNNGVNGGTFYAGDPSFVSAYGEVGFFITGESRGYKGGKWDRTKVLKPFDKGGIGAIQVNARLDYTDLEDRVAGTTLAAPNFVNGGKQTGYQLSVIWNPMDYIRFMAQYAHTDVEGGPRAAALNPTSTQPINQRSYNNDSFAVRAQLEF